MSRLQMSQIIEHTGVINQITGNHIRVSIIQQSACSGCHAKGACTATDMDEKMIDIESSDSSFKVGDMVLLNGWGVGEGHWGGLGQMARVKADWLIPLPKGFSAKQALAIGTAGYTAMLCVMALQKHGLKPSDGEVLVTGAAGGVGSFAIALLSKLGFTVVASTGRQRSNELV